MENPARPLMSLLVMCSARARLVKEYTSCVLTFTVYISGSVLLPCSAVLVQLGAGISTGQSD